MSKFPGNTFLRNFNKQFSKIKATLTHYKARQILRDLFRTNQGNGLEMTYAAGATKINLKNLETYLWLDELV